MKRLEVRFTRTPGDALHVGTLAADAGRLFFEYDASFLVAGLELSPFRLPLAAGVREHTNHEFGPLPGLFDDSLPDGWGLLLMDRHFARLGVPSEMVHPLDRLAFLGSRTMGALTYHPPANLSPFDDAPLNLPDLAAQAQAVLAGETQEVLPQLLKLGGSPGGARPKVLVALRRNQLVAGVDELPAGFQPWLIKFAAREDARDAGPVEYAYALMARAAGIELPAVRLFRAGRDRFFGARRFDRDGKRRFHVHTFGGLIEANFRIPSCDYRMLFRAAAALTRDHRDVLEVFRRTLFNVLAHNRDDHVKNFAFLLDDAIGQWRLAPAYDLTFAHGPGGEHTMTVAGEGKNPSMDNCVSLASEAGLTNTETREVIEQVRAAIARWPKFADQAEVTKAANRRIESAIQSR